MVEAGRVVTGQPSERRMSAEPEEEVAALFPCCQGGQCELAHVATVSKGTYLVHLAPCTSSNDPCRRRYIERVLTVAASPDNVTHGAVSVISYVHRERMSLHDIRTRCDDTRLTVLVRQAECREESTDLRRRSTVGRGKVVEGGTGVVEGEVVGEQDELLEQQGERLGREGRIRVEHARGRGWCLAHIAEMGDAAPARSVDELGPE